MVTLSAAATALIAAVESIDRPDPIHQRRTWERVTRTLATPGHTALSLAYTLFTHARALGHARGLPWALEARRLYLRVGARADAAQVERWLLETRHPG